MSLLTLIPSELFSVMASVSDVERLQSLLQCRMISDTVFQKETYTVFCESSERVGMTPPSFSAECDYVFLYRCMEVMRTVIEGDEGAPVDALADRNLAFSCIALSNGDASIQALQKTLLSTASVSSQQKYSTSITTMLCLLTKDCKEHAGALIALAAACADCSLMTSCGPRLIAWLLGGDDTSNASVVLKEGMSVFC